MSIRTLIGAVAACIAVAAPALATIKVFLETNGLNWNEPGNWSPFGVPGPADRVIINAGKLCVIPINYGAYADTIDVRRSGNSVGSLYIEQGATLTLDNNSPHLDDPDHSVVDGWVYLNSDSTAPATLFFTAASHTISGAGRIEGFNHLWCKIKIDNGITVTNNLASFDDAIRGGITFEGTTTGTQAPGVLKNNGLIHATTMEYEPFADRTIKFASNLQLADTPSAKWKVTTCDCHMEFYRVALSLRGTFYVGLANTGFDFYANVKTCGYLERELGAVQVYNGAVFQYASYSGGNSQYCPTPAGSGGNGTCAQPWVVSVSDLSCVTTCEN